MIIKFNPSIYWHSSAQYKCDLLAFDELGNFGGRDLRLLLTIASAKVGGCFACLRTCWKISLIL